MQFLAEDGCGEITVCGNAFVHVHFEPAEHDRNQPVVTVSVILINERVCLPAGAGASDEVKYFAWLRWRKAPLPCVVQSIHDALQDVERREPAHAAAIESEQAESCGVERGWLSAVLGRLLHISICA